MIDILLATYNAQTHIKALLTSLQLQTFSQWNLLVHDDGSTDKTLDIIKEFAEIDKRIKLIDDGIRLKSAARNFLHLLHFSTAPFVICCDDDDIWLENKLELLYNTICQKDNAIPQAVWCNSYVYKPEKAEISGYATLFQGQLTLENTLFANSGIQGCAIMFNNKLCELCKCVPHKVAMHDHLLTIAALTFGEMTYLPMRLMLYRRYDGTVTGFTAKSFQDKLSHFFEKGKSVIDRKHFEAIQSFYELHQDKMPYSAKKSFDQYFAYVKRGRFANLLAVVFKDKFTLLGNKSILILKILLRPIIGV